MSPQFLLWSPSLIPPRCSAANPDAVTYPNTRGFISLMSPKVDQE